MANFFSGQDGFVWFTGVVEDRDDPEKLGRVRVRCVGYHSDDLEEIPTKDLPWSWVLSTVHTSMNGLGHTPRFLGEGTWVVGFFRDAMEKQQPVIIGTFPGNPQTTSNKELGFNDPNAKYPKSDFLDESDINRLAKGGADGKSHTSIAAKEDKRDKGVLTAVTDQTWDEPASTYAAVYPFNHVYETESGHYKEFDDTEGKERISEYHKAGTFYEVDADGNKITRIVGSNYEVVAGSEFVNVKGDCNLTVDSNCRTYIKGNWDIQVDGNKTVVVKGNHSETVSGTQSSSITGDVTESYGAKQNTTADDNIDIRGKRIDLNKE